MGNLTEHDKMVLKRDGFVAIEIQQFDEAIDSEGKPQNINIESDGWKRIRADREKYMHKYRKGGAGYKQYESHMNGFIARRKGTNTDTAFDFLKAEYARYVSQAGKEPNPSDLASAKVVKKLYKGWWWR